VEVVKDEPIIGPTRVTIIIPAWNEAESIGRVLAAIPKDQVDDVLVVDGGSTDRTAAMAQAAGARVFVEERRGYGRACASGAEQALGEILVFMDADGADDPRFTSALLAPLRAGQADLVLGSRLAGQMESGAMPWHQKAGNWLSAGLIRRLYGCRLTDLSPFRAVRKARLAELNMREMTYGWPTEMLVKAARRGWRLVEVPVDYRARLGGRSKISGTFKGTLLATYFILKTIAQYARGAG
jgi:glycosyltransferase involved in cell wall biosynthesis